MYLLGSPTWYPIVVGTNFWRWFPLWYLGQYTLYFPWIQERIYPKETKITSLPFLNTRWAHSVFHWWNHLATVFVPSIDLDDVTACIEALTEFTQQDLNDSWQSLSLLNTEMSPIRKAVLQNKMDLGIITALEGNTSMSLSKKIVICSYLISLLMHCINYIP